MITPDQPAPEGPSVSIEAIAIDGVPPAVGDEIEYTGKGRITQVQNGRAFIETTEINGQPCGSESTEPDKDDVMRAAMEADAAA